jgi:hypothetical protein
MGRCRNGYRAPIGAPKVKDNVKSDEEPINSILAEDAMEKNRDYVLRGRRFRDVDTDILRTCAKLSRIS